MILFKGAVIIYARGGLEDFEGGSPVLYIEFEGGSWTLYMACEGGSPILYMKNPMKFFFQLII